MKVLLFLKTTIVEFIRGLTWLRVITGLLIFLFLYTAFSKLIVYDVYVRDLQRQRWISEYAEPLSIILPIVEFALSALLFFPRIKLWGLYGSLGFMIVLTTYVSALVFTQEDLPCSCGGLIRDLTWKEHFFFNIFCTTLPVVGIYLFNRKQRRQTTEVGLYV